MKRFARAAVVGSGVFLCLAIYLLVTAEVLGSGEGRSIVTGKVTSVNPTSSGVQVCVVDARSTHTYCGETSAPKAAGFAFHLDQCVLVEPARHLVIGIQTTDTSPCQSE